jgi:hypothetical protein
MTDFSPAWALEMAETAARNRMDWQSFVFMGCGCVCVCLIGGIASLHVDYRSRPQLCVTLEKSFHFGFGLRQWRQEGRWIDEQPRSGY